MDIKQQRMRKIKSLIFSRGFKMKEIMEKFNYKSYEGFKRAIKENRKNRYDEVLNYLEA